MKIMKYGTGSNNKLNAKGVFKAKKVIQKANRVKKT